MKSIKWTITMVLMLVCFGLSAQNKWQIAKAQEFADAAAKEWNLKDKQKADVYEAHLAAVVTALEAGKEEKAGSITLEERKAKQKEAWKKSNTTISEITGKNPKDIVALMNRLREKAKQNK